ncbi:hypothetical protein ACOME3_009749 [Neoechinorhynchus agilis]
MVNAIMDTDGTFLQTEVNGKIICKCNLSGMPNVTIKFSNPEILYNATFHHCVKLSEWEKSGTVFLKNPRGTFTLANYYVDAEKRPSTIQVRMSVQINPIRIKIEPNRGLTIDDVLVDFDIGLDLSGSMKASTGKVSSSENQDGWKILWKIGKLTKTSATLSTRTYNHHQQQISPRLIRLRFSRNQDNFTGLRISRVDVAKMVGMQFL